VSARTPQHLADAVASLDVDLTDDEVSSLEGPYLPHIAEGI
jgi:aryl-alcohol dehydrogenase-like predicted oxidoreductase